MSTSQLILPPNEALMSQSQSQPDSAELLEERQVAALRLEDLGKPPRAPSMVFAVSRIREYNLQDRVGVFAPLRANEALVAFYWNVPDDQHARLAKADTAPKASTPRGAMPDFARDCIALTRYVSLDCAVEYHLVTDGFRANAVPCDSSARVLQIEQGKVTSTVALSHLMTIESFAVDSSLASNGRCCVIKAFLIGGTGIGSFSLCSAGKLKT